MGICRFRCVVNHRENNAKLVIFGGEEKGNYSNPNFSIISRIYLHAYTEHVHEYVYIYVMYIKIFCCYDLQSSISYA